MSTRPTKSQPVPRTAAEMLLAVATAQGALVDIAREVFARDKDEGLECVDLLRQHETVYQAFRAKLLERATFAQIEEADRLARNQAGGKR